MRIRHTLAAAVIATGCCALALADLATPVKPPGGGAAAEVGKDAKEGKKPKAPKTDASDVLFGQGLVPKLTIEVTPANVEKLKAANRAYVPCTVREVLPGRPERVYTNVAIHLKGGAGSFRNFDDKPGLTLNFDKFADGQSYHDLDKLHLNNCAQDGSMMSENLGGVIFRSGGIAAARCTNARVWLNGRDLGFYVLKEGFDTPMLKRGFEKGSGVLFDGGFCQDIDQKLAVRHLKVKLPPAVPTPSTPPGAPAAAPVRPADPVKAAAEARRREDALRQKLEDEAERQHQLTLKELVGASREPDLAKRRERLGKVLDIDKFLTFMVLEAMTAHWDGYTANRNNYRIYHDPSTDKLVFLPHGMDQLFQRADFPMLHGGTIVAQGVLSLPEARSRYYERMAELRKTAFDPEVLCKRLDEISSRLRPALVEVSRDKGREHDGALADMKRRVVERAKFIDKLLAGVPQPLKFDQAGFAAIPVKAWEQKAEGGDAQYDRPVQAGRPRLRIRAGASGAAASFRSPVLLEPGRYVLEGRCSAMGVVPLDDQPNAGAGMRISGGLRTQRLVGDSGWQPFTFEFEVTEAGRETVLVCELRAKKGEAWFDPESIRLRKR